MSNAYIVAFQSPIRRRESYLRFTISFTFSMVVSFGDLLPGCKPDENVTLATRSRLRARAGCFRFFKAMLPSGLVI